VSWDGAGGTPVSLSLIVLPSRDGSYCRVTAYGIVQGRYASVAGVSVPLGDVAPPRDAEELASLLLPLLAAVVYGT
jgi:hypothetical protein